MPARRIQVLFEISLLVEQADTHQGHAEIAGRFQMIPGEHTEAPGKHGQALGQAELRREIRHKHGSGVAISPMEPCGWAVHVRIEFLELAVQMREKGFVLCRCLQLRLVNGTQHQDRVVPGGFPQLAVEASKQLDSIVVPSPAEVVGQLAKPFKRSGQRRNNLEHLDGSHGPIIGPRDLFL